MLQKIPRRAGANKRARQPQTQQRPKDEQAPRQVWIRSVPANKDGPPPRRVEIVREPEDLTWLDKWPAKYRKAFFRMRKAMDDAFALQNKTLADALAGNLKGAGRPRTRPDNAERCLLLVESLKPHRAKTDRQAIEIIRREQPGWLPDTRTVQNWLAAARKLRGRKPQSRK